MKNAILLHGTGGSDKDYFWFADTKKFLESKGYEVWWPLLPNTESPNLVETRSFIEQNLPAINEETVIIGHSSACPLILHMLQFSKVKVRQVVLVSGYYVPQANGSSSMLPKSFDWELIKSKADDGDVMINKHGQFQKSLVLNSFLQKGKDTWAPALITSLTENFRY
jgi:predicted alpha/beta hydrolase family esterase